MSDIRATCAVLAAGAVLVAGCTSDPPQAAPPPSSVQSAKPVDVRLEPECPGTWKKRLRPTADQINKRISSGGLPAWQAADIGASARLSDGRLVWLFGDTVRTADLSPRIVANSMLITSGSCVAQLRTPVDGPVIPDVKSNIVRWPMSVAVGRRGSQDVVVVLCSRIRRGSGGSFDFTFLGTSAAVFTV